MDLSPFENLPTLSREEAAWLVGITPEAYDRFMVNSNAKMTDGHIAVLDLLRAGFVLLSRKEAQAAMLGLQLSRSLEREKNLATTLQSSVFGDALPIPVTEECPDTFTPEKKKKKKKKKK
ncbi:MAG: hypothetical protein HQL63_12015 [Magnetococcales bacterium]|nr:hypothetical protein [Magnetococcales bacterium]MBF0323154.1 hypothetical protein [Magnetococcales bacterium]